ncbi:hypothetical protein GMORB2_1256 [Geosmithia morbida]|uniref:Kinesin motor domain-containing protein n=1 Tax=Geosmithia morbida TaxID=1094350 RepID=A0A9P4Z1K8_9HYPO|nr:uncharacterized protein GMORB2_1256 [Geosmithia morbida]KAF4126010.1 hypothetical protein GMORB2_1256 [Geosmithia morbida]
MSIRVVARIRPLLEKELDKDIIVRPDSVEAGSPNTIVKIPNPKNDAEDFSFAFNSVYDQSTTQEDLFTSEVAPHIKSLFLGYDVTIFAYGVTGTGKTHTMRGGLKLADRGVIPRLLSGVFRRGKKITRDSDGQTTVQVALSYYEIYNDKVYDLLEPPEKRTPSGLPLRAEANGRTVVAGLTERACEDLRDFEKMYIEANNNRVTAATKLNAHSSRSHAILRVKLIQTTGDMVRESTASAIDLAGSEDNRRTDNGRERLVESAAINKSLFVLSQCIEAISRGDKRIPYRESKMTRILSLGQNQGITVMILNLAPLRSYHLDTLSSLNVSSRAKRIEAREIENEVVFKQMPKQSSSGLGLGGAQRQPLRPLANAHNVGVAKDGAGTKDVARPVKAFAVYTDKAAKPGTTLPGPVKSTLGGGRRTTLGKRSSDCHESPVSSSYSRPSKLARPRPSMAAPSYTSAPATSPSVVVTAAEIEAMVQKKVSEALAHREHASEDMSRRLEALERRVNGGEYDEEDNAEGLRLLLAARQHKDNGEDAAALQAYEMAVPYFPGQPRLQGKINRLRARLGLKDEASVHTAPQSTAAAPKRKKRKHSLMVLREGEVQVEYADEVEPESTSTHLSICEGHEEQDRENFSPVPIKHQRSASVPTVVAVAAPTTRRPALQPIIAKPKRRSISQQRSAGTSSNNATVQLDPDMEVDSRDDAPQAQKHLLDIVNSRDINQFHGLVGLGTKRARDVVDFLDEAEEGEHGQRVDSLSELRAIPGLGGRAADRGQESLVMSAV